MVSFSSNFKNFQVDLNLFFFFFLDFLNLKNYFFFSVDNLIKNWKKILTTNENFDDEENQKKGKNKNEYYSLATFALIIQIMIIYVDSALHKVIIFLQFF